MVSVVSSSRLVVLSTSSTIVTSTMPFPPASSHRVPFSSLSLFLESMPGTLPGLRFCCRHNPRTWCDRCLVLDPVSSVCTFVHAYARLRQMIHFWLPVQYRIVHIHVSACAYLVTHSLSVKARALPASRRRNAGHDRALGLSQFAPPDIARTRSPSGQRSSVSS